MEDLGFGEQGVMLVRPQAERWKFKAKIERSSGDSLPKEVNMRRVQLPLCPEKPRTVESAQGLSMDSASMIFTKSTNMSDEDWWLHIYVMLSRVRTADQVLIFGDLPPQKIFENGPPQWIQDGLLKLQRQAGMFAGCVAEAKAGMDYRLASGLDVCGEEVAWWRHTSSRDAKAASFRVQSRNRCRGSAVDEVRNCLSGAVSCETAFDASKCA